MQIKRIAAAAALALASTTSAVAAPIQWADNGHWYEFVATNVTWADAFNAANSATHNGLQGYLATITSADENNFASLVVANGVLAWLGGSDSGAAINDWTWRNGPENGQAFTYTNWNGGEPNNCCGGEDFLHTNFGAAAGWNDHGGPGNAGQQNGYIIEYSGTPAEAPIPATISLMLIAGLAGYAQWRKR